MIIFVVDQVAGAEYVFPLLNKWLRDNYKEWTVIASSVSSSFLKQRSIPSVELILPSFNAVSDVIEEFKPAKAILSSSGNSLLEGLFLLKLKERKIPTYSFIDYWGNYSKRFQHNNDQMHFNQLYPDGILTIDKQAKEEMIIEKIPENIIKVIGQPYFEYCLESIKNSIKAKGEGLILLVTQPVSYYFEKRLGYDEKGFLNVFLDVWRSLEKDWSKINIVVHPAENCETYKSLTSKYSPDITILRGNDCHLRDYSLVVGMFSSLMIQSVLAGINTISLQPGACGADMNFLSRYGYIERLTSGNSLHLFLMNYPIFPERKSKDVEGLKSSLKGSCKRFEKIILNDFVED